ncbi:MAG: hypothetical protein GWM87_09850, partial [Xanthomonadales bacterium]|nr:hypothetical protein [Xanthomonadales bacterium]NIX13199.1 hypothetical protein [Xanthomonadales bacterium]
NFKAVTERRLGLWEASIVSFERAHELDPANVFIVATWAETLMRMRDWKR